MISHRQEKCAFYMLYDDADDAVEDGACLARNSLFTIRTLFVSMASK